MFKIFELSKSKIALAYAAKIEALIGQPGFVQP